MKISKNSQTINSNTETQPAAETGKYNEAIDYIRSAIDSLGAVAKDDDVAKDAIANLSVILFDLK